MKRVCMVPGCQERLRTPRLCSKHTVEWNESAERYDGDHKREFKESFERWLTKKAAA